MMVLRPAVPEDEPFLRELRAEYDSERLGLDHVGEELQEYKRKVLDHNYRAHAAHYKSADWDRKECIIEFEGEAAGQVTVMQDSEEIRLADLVVSKKHRGKGLGHAVLQGIQSESMQSKRPIRLHVEKSNLMALQFYQMIGFQELEDRITHTFMEWVPPQTGGTIYSHGKP